MSKKIESIKVEYNAKGIPSWKPATNEDCRKVEKLYNQLRQEFIAHGFAPTQLHGIYFGARSNTGPLAVKVDYDPEVYLTENMRNIVNSIKVNQKEG